jgi:hypothetical protein
MVKTRHKRACVAKKVADVGKALTDGSDKFLASLKEQSEVLKKIGKTLGPVFPIVGTFFGVLGGLSSSSCKIEALLKEILEKLDKISLQLDSLERVIKCIPLKTEFRSIESKVHLLSKLLKDADSDPSMLESRRKNIITICTDPSEGITKMLSMFEFFLREKDFMQLVSNCAVYKSKEIKHWAGLMVNMINGLTLLAKGCSEALRISAPFDAQKLYNDLSNVFLYYDYLIQKRFVEDASDIGLKGVIRSLSDKSFNEIKKKLSEEYDYFDYDVFTVNKNLRGFDQHTAYYNEKCVTSGSYYHIEKDKGYYHVLVSWTEKGKSKKWKTGTVKSQTIYSQFMSKRSHSMELYADAAAKEYEGKYNFILAVNEVCTLLPYGTYAQIHDFNYGINVGCLVVKQSDSPCDRDYPKRVFDTPIVNLPIGKDGGFSNDIKQLAQSNRQITEKVDETNANVARYGEEIIRITNQTNNKVDYYGERGIEEREAINQKLDNGFNTLIDGQQDIVQRIDTADQIGRQERRNISQQISTGFSQLSRGQQQIREDIGQVGKDVKHYGETGIKERAEILNNVKHYGELGIEQRTKIINKLSVVHQDIGDIRTTQLEESNKATIRFDYLKFNLNEIKDIQLDEAKKSETRFNVLSGGIYDLKSMHVVEAKKNEDRFNVIREGVDGIKNHLSAESQVAQARFGVLNTGIEKIQNHQIIESQINEKRFTYLSTGVNDIRNLQVNKYT